MLATQLNERIHKGEIDKFAVVQVEKMVTNTIQNRKYVTFVSYDCHVIIMLIKLSFECQLSCNQLVLSYDCHVIIIH